MPKIKKAAAPKIKTFKPKSTKKKTILSRVAYKRIHTPSQNKKIGLLQINGRNYKVGTSKIEQQWLDSFHVINRQKVIYGFKGKVLIVDGIDPQRKIVYEMLGGFCHGSHITYKQNRDTKTWLGKTPNEMYHETINRFNFLYNLGYKIIFVWDYEYKAHKSTGRLYKGPGDNLY